MKRISLIKENILVFYQIIGEVISWRNLMEYLRKIKFIWSRSIIVSDFNADSRRRRSTSLFIVNCEYKIFLKRTFMYEHRNIDNRSHDGTQQGYIFGRLRVKAFKSRSTFSFVFWTKDHIENLFISFLNNYEKMRQLTWLFLTLCILRFIRNLSDCCNLWYFV